MAVELSENNFDDSATGQAQRWEMELSAAKKELAKFHKQGEQVLKRFRDERDGRNTNDSHLNLLSSNTQTMRALLFGKTPNVDVTRRHSDPNDDVARVGGEMLSRILNAAIQLGSDGYSAALEHALDDRLLPGFGNVRNRYVAEFEKKAVKAITSAEGKILADGYETEAKTHEDAETDYVHWKDQLWSPCRIFDEMRWWAVKAAMSREQLIARFGEKLGKVIPLNSKRNGRGDSIKNDPWARADIWEIWDKEHKKVFWYVEGYPQILDQKDDPLGLDNFWPFPRPMFANLTTSALVPLADFHLARDQYDEIDLLSTRINLLESAVKVAGVYDKTAAGVQRLLGNSTENVLIPIDNWAMFAEKGGLRGQIDWLPLDQIVLALDKLRELRTEAINLLFQVTGMSDIMRGQATAATTATEQAIKAKFASVRTQTLQDEFARFASDTQRIKAEIISKHFDPQTIIERSNILQTADAQLAEQAVQLIKSQFWMYRIEVKPESVNLTDYAQLRAERSEFLGAISGFLQAAIPAVGAMPGALPYLLQMLQWAMAGFKGSSTIEGVLDQAIAQAQQASMAPAQPPPPDPKLQAAQFKHESDMAKTHATLQADLTRIGAETQAEAQRKATETHFNIAESEASMRHKALLDVNNLIPKPGGAL